MKKRELRQLIREQVRKVLREQDDSMWASFYHYKYGEAKLPPKFAS